MSLKKALKIPSFEEHERFLKFIRVDVDTECWTWVGSKIDGGYGLFGVKPYTSLRAHRVSYSIFIGDMNPDKVIDHKCKNRSCVNPDHLREVTHKQNTIENSLSVTAFHAAKTHCKEGHAFNEENTYYRRHGRSCRICKRVALKKCRLKRKVDI